MRWLKRQLRHQLERIDIGEPSFFQRYAATDPDARAEILDVPAAILARDGKLNITVGAEPAGHFTLMVIWSHNRHGAEAKSVDLAELLQPMDSLDKEFPGENRHWPKYKS